MLLQETTVSFDPQTICWSCAEDDIVALVATVAAVVTTCRVSALLLENWRDRIPWKRLRWLWPLAWTSGCVAGGVGEVVTNRTARAGLLIEPEFVIACAVVWAVGYGSMRLTEWFVFRQREPLSLNLN